MAEAVVDNVPAKTGAPGSKPPMFGLAFLQNLSEMTMLRQVGLRINTHPKTFIKRGTLPLLVWHRCC